MTAHNRLEEASKLCPEVFRLVEFLIKDKVSGGNEWPDWCFLPMSGWLAIAGTGHEGEPSLQTALRAAQIAAPVTWSYTKGIYEFDPEVYTELLASEFTGRLPSEALLRLPEWAVYIKTPLLEEDGIDIEGFFATLEFDYERAWAELRLFIDKKDGSPLSPLVMHLGDWSIDESLNRMIQEAKWQIEKNRIDVEAEEIDREFDSISRWSRRLLPLVLYLCTDEPEIENPELPDWMPQNPGLKKIRGEMRLMPSRKVHHFMVGRKTGDALRSARKQMREHEASGRSVTPHIRRAHWHGFWTGPRKGPESIHQKYIFKWLAPILVQGSKDEITNL